MHKFISEQVWSKKKSEIENQIKIRRKKHMRKKKKDCIKLKKLKWQRD